MLLLPACSAYMIASPTSSIAPMRTRARVVGEPLAILKQEPIAEDYAQLYTRAEAPKVAGGSVLAFTSRRVVVITGASSGLGLSAMKALTKRKDTFVIAAVRDPEKMDTLAKDIGLSRTDYVAMKLELASLQSVKDFVRNLRLFMPTRPVNHLICNAAVYRPSDPEPMWTDDGYEMSLGVVRQLALAPLALPSPRVPSC